MKTFYVATSYENAEIAKKLSQELEKSGVLQNIYKWFEIDDGVQTGDYEQRGEYARIEIDATFNCDIFIMIAATSRGCHVELGSALASFHQNPKKQIFYYDEEQQVSIQTFYCHKSVKHRYGDMGILINEIVGLAHERNP